MNIYACNQTNAMAEAIGGGDETPLSSFATFKFNKINLLHRWKTVLIVPYELILPEKICVQIKSFVK